MLRASFAALDPLLLDAAALTSGRAQTGLQAFY